MKKKIFVLVAAFAVGILAAILALETRGLEGMYLLAACVAMISGIILRHRGRGRHIREIICAGLVLSVGPLTAGNVLGYAYAIAADTIVGDVTMHVFVAIVALLFVYTWMWKQRRVLWNN